MIMILKKTRVMMIGLLMLLLAGCTAQYSPCYPADEIRAIDIVEMEGHYIDDLKKATVVAHIEESSIQQFMEELAEINAYHTSPPECYLPGVCIRLEYENGDYEAVNSHCAVTFLEKRGFANRYVNIAFSQEEYSAFLEKYTSN